MAAVDIGARDNPPINDDLDNLFNYEVDNDIFKDVDINMDIAPKAPAGQDKDKSVFGGLGLDEEIQVRKKRVPIAKLDETRLLSQAGIPKLRRITRERFRFRGKGHEFSDVARMLKIYQLWLDDLYPRAKFADGLAMIEKLGHSKRMQSMRKEWIKEGKAKRTEGIGDGLSTRPSHEGPLSESRRVSGSSKKPERAQSPDLSANVAASMRQEGASPGTEGPADDSLFVSDGHEDANAPSDDELDDLDAILAEEDSRQKQTKPVADSQGPPQGQSYADDEEAMAEMGDIW